MAVLEATPSTVAAAVASAIRGDRIRLLGGIYGALPGKAGVTFTAYDYEPYRVLRGATGYFGQGMGVIVKGIDASPEDDINYEGVCWDSRESSSINAYLVNGDNVWFEGCAIMDRHVSARKIGFTVGQPSDRVRGFRFENGRYHFSGKPGDTHDHPFYMKNCDGWRVVGNLIHDAGHYGIHMYTNADNGLVEFNVIWGCGLGITFSGASDGTTGSSAYATSDGNTVRGNIIGNGRRSGALIETWTSDPARPVVGNRVIDNLITRGGGVAAIREASLPGVEYARNVDKDPGFRDPANGDFTRSGSYDGFGPAALFGAVDPPPPPPSGVFTRTEAEYQGVVSQRDQALAALIAADAAHDALEARIEATRPHLAAAVEELG